jgi:hypothetical protein
MTLKEILLQELETTDDTLIAEIIAWVRSHKRQIASAATSDQVSPPPSTQFSIVDFFRRSPLCEVADELDLTRDRSPIPDRIAL